jgi:hypothetical protein
MNIPSNKCEKCNCEISSYKDKVKCRYCGEEVKMENKGLKNDLGKIRCDLIPVEAIEELSKVLTFGANRYGDNNWQQVETSRYEAALLRHYIQYKKGEKIDPDSNLSHLSHMLCNVVFLLYKDLNRKDLE